MERMRLLLLALALGMNLPSASAAVVVRGSFLAGLSVNTPIGGTTPVPGLGFPSLVASLEVGSRFSGVLDVGYLGRGFTESGTVHTLGSIYLGLAPRFWIARWIYIDLGVFITSNTRLTGSYTAPLDYGPRFGLGLMIPVHKIVKIGVAGNFNYTFARVNSVSAHFTNIFIGLVLGL